MSDETNDRTVGTGDGDSTTKVEGEGEAISAAGERTRTTGEGTMTAGEGTTERVVAWAEGEGTTTTTSSTAGRAAGSPGVNLSFLAKSSTTTGTYVARSAIGRRTQVTGEVLQEFSCR